MPTTIDLKELLDTLDRKLNAPEARDLAFDLSLDWDNLRGETKRERLRDLLDVTWRRGQMAELLDAVHRRRPDVLPEIPVFTPPAPSPVAARTRRGTGLVVALLALGVAVVLAAWGWNAARGTARPPGTAQALYAEALDCYYNDRFDCAFDRLEQALRLDTHFGAAYDLRGVLYSRRGDNLHAFDDFSQAIALGFNPEALTLRAAIYLDRQEWDRAIGDCSSAVARTQPSDNTYYSDCLYTLGLAHKGKGDTDEARSYFQQIVDVGQNEAVVARARQQLGAPIPK